MIIEFDVLLGTKSYDDLLIGSNMFLLSLSLFHSFWRSIRTVPLAKFPNFPKRGVINWKSWVAGLEKNTSMKWRLNNYLIWKVDSPALKKICLIITSPAAAFVGLPHLEKNTISSPPRIVSIATGFGSVLWTFIMPMVMIFILRQDRNYADYLVPNTRKSLKLPQAIDVFFVFGATFEFLMFNRRTQPSTGPLLVSFLGLLNLATGSLLWAFLAVKMSWRSLSHRWFNGERWPQTFVLKRWIESKCLKCLKFTI